MVILRPAYGLKQLSEYIGAAAANAAWERLASEIAEELATFRDFFGHNCSPRSTLLFFVRLSPVQWNRPLFQFVLAQSNGPNSVKQTLRGTC
jgi:hypothetical protein